MPSETHIQELPIGVFDSGLGGVSVLGELLLKMPRENYIYLGDSAYAPYGSRTPDDIRQRVLSCAEELYQAGIKALVVACNTATGVAISDLREKYPDIPVVGIEPAIKPASLQKTSPHVVVMATPVTLNQGKFRDLLSRFTKTARIDPIPCRGIVERIEAGQEDSAEMYAVLHQLLDPFIPDPPDSIVLGCTHYPLIREQIRAVCRQDFPETSVTLLDGGAGTARQTRKQLADRGWLNEKGQGSMQVRNTAGEDMCRSTLEMLEKYNRKENQ